MFNTNHTAKPAIEKEYIKAKPILKSRVFHTPFSNYSFIPLYQVEFLVRNATKTIAPQEVLNRATLYDDLIAIFIRTILQVNTAFFRHVISSRILLKITS